MAARSNTRTHHVQHRSGEDYRHNRNTSKSSDMKMSQGKRRGLDYTPLYRFLLSKVGSHWNTVYSEVLPRIEDPTVVDHIVARNRQEALPYVRIGEASYFSGLFVDEAGFLRATAPEIDETSLEPSCECCTHSFNGKAFSQPHPSIADKA